MTKKGKPLLAMTKEMLSPHNDPTTVIARGDEVAPWQSHYIVHGSEFKVQKGLLRWILRILLAMTKKEALSRNDNKRRLYPPHNDGERRPLPPHNDNEKGRLLIPVSDGGISLQISYEYQENVLT